MLSTTSLCYQLSLDTPLQPTTLVWCTFLYTKPFWFVREQVQIRRGRPRFIRSNFKSANKTARTLGIPTARTKSSVPGGSGLLAVLTVRRSSQRARCTTYRYLPGDPDRCSPEVRNYLFLYFSGVGVWWVLGFYGVLFVCWILLLFFSTA